MDRHAIPRNLGGTRGIPPLRRRQAHDFTGYYAPPNSIYDVNVINVSFYHGMWGDDDSSHNRLVQHLFTSIKGGR